MVVVVVLESPMVALAELQSLLEPEEALHL